MAKVIKSPARKRSRKRSSISTVSFDQPRYGIIVPDDNQAVKLATLYGSMIKCCEKDFVTRKHKGIEMYQVQNVVFAYIPGYNRDAVDALCDALHSLGGSYRQLFLVTTAVSCTCVKEGVNDLISINAIHSSSCSNKEDYRFGFYLSEGAKKAYPAVAVSQCDQKLPKNKNPSVQVLLNLSVPVDALTIPEYLSTNPLVVMGVNVEKIQCKYKQVTARKLFDNKHYQTFVTAVVMFVSQLANEDDSLPMTPPPSGKKQKLQTNEGESKLKDFFPDPNSAEQHSKQRKIIEKFERDHLISTLSPNDMPNFARCLGLTDNDYEHIEYDYNRKNSKEQIHCIIKRWFEKDGFQANIINFDRALQLVGNKNLCNIFFLFCNEARKP